MGNCRLEHLVFLGCNTLYANEIDISQGNSMLYSGISNYFAIITDKSERNTQMSYVEFKNVSKTYNTGDVSVEALKDASFEIGKGEICVIVGQ